MLLVSICVGHASAVDNHKWLRRPCINEGAPLADEGIPSFVSYRGPRVDAVCKVLQSLSSELR